MLIKDVKSNVKEKGSYIVFSGRPDPLKGFIGDFATLPGFETSGYGVHERETKS